MLAYSDALGGLRERANVDLRQLIAGAAAPLAGWDLALYVVDFAHRVLFPLPATLTATGETAEGQPVDGVEVFMEETSRAASLVQHDSISDIHVTIDECLTQEYSGEAFATGIVGRLNLRSGTVLWSSAGHPAPLLLRGRKVVAELSTEPALPFGLGNEAPTVERQQLQPGDVMVLYTDGVVEARTPDGDEFGVERLIDHLEREAAGENPSEEMLRRVTEAVVAHHQDSLRDDATLLIIQWFGPSTLASGVPGQRSGEQAGDDSAEVVEAGPA